MDHKSQQLIQKFNAGQMTAAEEAELEKLIEQGIVRLEDLTELQQLDEKLGHFYSQQLSLEMRQQFDAFLSAAKLKHSRSGWQKLRVWFSPFRFGNPVFQAFFATLCLVIGIFIGNAFRKEIPVESKEIAQINMQMQDIQQMLMMTLLEKESTTERLKAVNLTKTMPEVTEEVTDALLYTLNYDENTNVRLAALESLFKYADQPRVREGLVKSIVNQESPMVQLAMAEVMVALQEKGAIEPFETLMKGGKIPSEVKESIQESMEVLL